MRYVVDLAVFVGVFLLGLLVFKSASYAMLAALIVAGAAEALLGSSFKR
ncbi:MAG TPA: hypothetical protein PLV61_13695 [Parvularculaceae bacterium]|nr:hypothetical protein [Amphiplicatus sp.]HOP20323.1 hypothetical protein [Amphiplicatus sp.]HPE32240.1 hypothetical protein [Parvularculaceae bacterium]